MTAPRRLDAPRHLGAVRIAVFGTWVVVLARMPLGVYADLPRSMIEARGLMRLLPTEALVGSPLAMGSLRGAALIGCALCVVGIRPFSAVAVPTVLAVAMLDGAVKSVALYANHDLSALLLVAAVVALFPASDALSVHGPLVRSTPGDLHRIGLRVAVLVFALTYALIGIRRLITGGVEIYGTESLRLWFVTRSSEWAAYRFDTGLQILEHSWLVPALAVGMLVVTGFEALSPLVLRSGPFRVAWVAVVGSFHVLTLVMMRIFFWPNLVLIAVLVVWPAWRETSPQDVDAAVPTSG